MLSRWESHCYIRWVLEQDVVSGCPHITPPVQRLSSTGLGYTREGQLPSRWEVIPRLLSSRCTRLCSTWLLYGTHAAAAHLRAEKHRSEPAYGDCPGGVFLLLLAVSENTRLENGQVSTKNTVVLFRLPTTTFSRWNRKPVNIPISSSSDT